MAVIVLAAVAAIALIAGVGLSSKGSDNAATATAARIEATSLLAAGAAQQRAGEITLATATYTDALRLQPTNAVLSYDLGTIAQQTGNRASALSYYDRALTNDPTMTPALFNKAVLVTVSDPSEAITLYRRVLSVKADAPTTFFNLGLLLVASPTTKGEGLADLARAVSMDPVLGPLVPAALVLPTVAPVTSTHRTIVTQGAP